MLGAKRTLFAAIWSLSQSIFVKFFSLILFFLFTWFLSPEQFGAAAAVILVLILSQIFVEAGVPYAIVQKKKLSECSFNLPFLFSILTALLIGFVLFIFSTEIALLLSIEEYAFYLSAVCFVPFFLAFKVYFEAFYQRQMNFKAISIATIVATILSGMVSFSLAYFDFGAISLISQFVILNFLIAFFLFLRSSWKPSLEFASNYVKEIYKYSSMNFFSRIVDFSSSRVIDFIVLTKFGIFGLGLYTVASKLYLTMIELFATSLVKVFFSAFSHIQDDKKKLKENYLRLLFFSSSISTPMFLSLLFLSTPLSELFLNQDWAGVDSLMEILSLLGAVLVVQYFNGALINSTGRSGIILFLNVLKFLSAITFLLFLNFNSIEELIKWYVLSQLLVTPLTFYYAAIMTESGFWDILKNLLPSVIASILSVLVVQFFSELILNQFNPFVAILCLLFSFSLIYLCFLLLFSYRKLKNEFALFKLIMRSGSHNVKA